MYLHGTYVLKLYGLQICQEAELDLSSDSIWFVMVLSMICHETEFDLSLGLDLRDLIWDKFHGTGQIQFSVMSPGIWVHSEGI